MLSLKKLLKINIEIRKTPEKYQNEEKEVSVQSFISSCKQRALRAHLMLKNSPERSSYACRKAYAKYYLVDDLVRLLEYRREYVSKTMVQFSAITDMDELENALERFRMAKRVAKEQLDMGNVKTVRRAIPERKLMAAAKYENNYAYLIEIANEIMLEIKGFGTTDI